MTTPRLTQCPHCKASFKVSEEQLNAAGGRVRCGSCLNIFDAIAYSISESTAPKSTTETNEVLIKSSAETHSSDSPLIDLEDTILEDDTALFQDDPEEDKKEQGYAGSIKITDDLSTSFLELDETTETSSSNPYITSIQEIELVESNTEDESWTEEILDEMLEDEVVEPHISDNSNDTITTEPYGEFENTGSLGNSIFPEPTNPSAENFKEKEQTYENFNFYAQQDSDLLNRHWLTSSILTISITALLVLLLAQASWLHYEKLAQYPQIASLYKAACNFLKCELPKLADLTQIKSNNLIVRSHPTTPKALIIDAIIINKASYEQAFPDIALYFSDINNKTIAQRLIHPKEYLSGEILSWIQMPSKQPIHISLEILDPGKEAVNYTLTFFTKKS